MKSRCTEQQPSAFVLSFDGDAHCKAHAVRSVPHVQGEEALGVAGSAAAPLDQYQDVSVPSGEASQEEAEAGCRV